MILLVFEGKDDSYIFKTLEHLFFKKNERRICCFNQNIYELFRLMQESDFTEDIVSVIRDRRKFPEGNPLADVKDVADISEVYLFFDYDFQNKNITLEEANRQVEEMLHFFDNENENGKLYIHYPMLESLRCTEELPDEHYWQYTVGRDACDHFKNWTTTQYTYYKSMDFAVLPIDKRKGELRLDHVSAEQKSKIKDNWQLLKQQNVSKANYICTGNNEMPLKKEDIRQLAIFRNQVYNYVNTKECCVSILNAFPLFLYEYFKQ